MDRPAAKMGRGANPGVVNHGSVNRQGTNGVTTKGVTAIFMVFDRGTFRVLPLTFLYIAQSARETFFSICQNVLLLQRPH